MQDQRVKPTRHTSSGGMLYRIRFYGEASADRGLRLKQARSPLLYRGNASEYLVRRAGCTRWLSVRCAWCRVRCLTFRKRATARYRGVASCPACLRKFVVDARRPEMFVYPLIFAILIICIWRFSISGSMVPMAVLVALHVAAEVLLTMLSPQRRTTA